MRAWANPSSPHAEGRAARAKLEQARAAIAAAYGWRGETILTSGASESLAIALLRSGAERRLISAVEHDAVIRAGGDAGVAPEAQGSLTCEAGRPARRTGASHGRSMMGVGRRARPGPSGGALLATAPAAQGR